MVMGGGIVSGALFLVVVTFVCIGSFVSGLRFVRMRSNPWVGRSIFSQPVSGGDWSPAQIRWFGLAQMIVAPVFWLFAAALSFGLLPAEGISPIQF